MKAVNYNELFKTIWTIEQAKSTSDFYTVAEKINDTTSPTGFYREWAERTPKTELEFAKDLSQRLPIQYNEQTREFHLFEGHIWIPVSENLVIRLAGALAEIIAASFDTAHGYALDVIRTNKPDDKGKALLKQRDSTMKPHKFLIDRMQTLAGQKAALGLLKTLAPLDEAQAIEDDKNFLVFRNGVLDVQQVIETGKAELLEHSWARLCTRMIDFDLDLNATAPDWVQFLSESVVNHEEAVYLEKSLGCALFGERDTRRVISLQGAPRSGKSTILDIMGDIFPMFSATPQHAAITSGHGAKTTANARYDMRVSRFVMFSEVRSKLDSDFLLGYSTIDKFQAEQKFKASASYDPQGTIFIANNVPLNLDKSDPAMATRLAKVSFPQTFSESDPEHTLDRQLPNRLREQAPGIIARLVNAFILRHEQGIDRPESMQRELEAERMEDDLVGQFIEDMKSEGRLAETEAKPSNCVKAGALYKLFQEDLRAQGHKATDLPLRKEFNSRVHSMGYEYTKSGSWVFTGLTLR